MAISRTVTQIAVSRHHVKIVIQAFYRLAFSAAALVSRSVGDGRMYNMQAITLYIEWLYIRYGDRITSCLPSWPERVPG